MNLLNAGYPPLRQASLKSWSTTFQNLVAKSTEVKIVTAYASEESLNALVDFLKDRKSSMPKVRVFEFILGLAYFEGLTQRQLVALMKVEELLSKLGLGHVHISQAIGIHSKCSIYRINGEWHGVLGSTNFSAFVPQRKAETDIYLGPNNRALQDLIDYVNLVQSTTSKLTRSVSAKIPIIKRRNIQLAQSALVETATPPLIDPSKAKVTFEIPIKSEPKSNLNKFNASPRGAISRSWWEVELIVPTPIQKAKDFPNKPDGTDVFHVITDDGYKFKCHVSGGEKPRLNKNFESDGDLKVLGYWVKGKLLESGVLSEGELVTEQTIKDYGRDSVTFTKISKNLWALNYERH